MSDLQPTTRECTKCGKTKLLTEFYRAKRGKYGRCSQCPDCFKAYNEANRPKIQAYFKKLHLERRNDPAYRAIVRKAGQRFDAKQGPDSDWRIRHRATAKVAYALRMGRLERGPCERCGAIHGIDGVEIEGHHDDYSKPLEVRWLCKMPCHIDHHREMREALRQ